MMGVVKITLFAGLVLVLGNLIQWKGRTVSDQVKTGVAQAEKSQLAAKAHNLIDLSQQAFRTSANQRNHLKSESAAKTTDPQHPTFSERQKLRTLIQELNSNTD